MVSVNKADATRDRGLAEPHLFQSLPSWHYRDIADLSSDRFVTKAVANRFGEGCDGGAEVGEVAIVDYVG